MYKANKLTAIAGSPVPSLLKPDRDCLGAGGALNPTGVLVLVPSASRKSVVQYWYTNLYHK